MNIKDITSILILSITLAPFPILLTYWGRLALALALNENTKCKFIGTFTKYNILSFVVGNAGVAIWNMVYVRPYNKSQIIFFIICIAIIYSLILNIKKSRQNAETT